MWYMYELIILIVDDFFYFYKIFEFVCIKLKVMFVIEYVMEVDFWEFGVFFECFYWVFFEGIKLGIGFIFWMYFW